MDYLNKSFSVQMGGRKPEGCNHGWVAKGKCVMCGEASHVTNAQFDALIAEQIAALEPWQREYLKRRTAELDDLFSRGVGFGELARGYCEEGE